MKMTKTAAFLIAMSRASCATTQQPIGQSSYRLSIIDNSAQQRFDLVLINKEAHAICVDIDEWPTGRGQLRVDDGQVSVEVDSKRYISRGALSTAYCPGGCGELRVEAGAELRGSLDYRWLEGFEPELAHYKKRLNFYPHVRRCSK